MNRASKDFAWTRKSGGSPTGLSRIARKGRARTGFAMPAAMIFILLSIACNRQAVSTHRQDSLSLSFQGPGTFSKLEKQMADNYDEFIQGWNVIKGVEE